MASAELAQREPDTKLTNEVLASLVTRGDISGLRPEQKAAYYAQLCTRVGLDPTTAPFQALKLNGKEILYATKGAAEQLRNLHKISVTIVARERIEDVFFVTARATMPDGRADESQGAVAIGGLKGDNLANAIMKAETKAKRRVTLSIVGLGMLDESELDMINPDRFAKVPQEVKTAGELGPKIVTLKDGAVVPPEQIDKERKQTKKSEGLPKVPAKIVEIPAAILLSVKPLNGLDGVPLAKMTDDDLELVAEQMTKVREVWRITASSQRALDWLDAIGAEAKRLLTERNGVPVTDFSPPPPDDGHDDAPADEEMSNFLDGRGEP